MLFLGNVTQQVTSNWHKAEFNFISRFTKSKVKITEVESYGLFGEN